MRVEVWFATFRACLLHPISERRKTLHSWVSQNWRKGSFFSVAFCLTLRKPQGEHTTDLTPPPGNVNEKKKLWCRHWKFTNDSHTTAQVLLCYDCLRVTHQYRHGTHIFKPRILSCGLGAHNYRVVNKSLKTLNLCATLRLNQEFKLRIMEQWCNSTF